jgi:mono/diheme cytochrome c family protein
MRPLTITRGLTCALLGAALATGCRTTEQVPEYDGSALYQGYCAGCHGPSGAGDGPVSQSLAVGMQDLRKISERNGGAFPRQRLLDMIDGRELRAAHGTPDMPVWGWEFRRVEESPAHAQARIDALVSYLEAIQN